MNIEAWKNTIGESAWHHITQGVPDIEAIAAGVLTRAVEAGFREPTGPSEVAPSGTKVLLRATDGEGVVPVLTAEGLRRFWAGRGHGFLILRTDQLMKATEGPLLRWLQVIVQAYEEECAQEGIEPIPIDWRVFVGGTQETGLASEVINALYDQSPKPDRSNVQRVHIAGPHAKG